MKILNSELAVRIAPSDLDKLMSSLEVRFVALTECLVSSGYRLQMGGFDAPGMHYNLCGRGKMFIGNGAAIDLVPHTLVIVPPKSPFRIECAGTSGTRPLLKTVDGRLQAVTKGSIRHVTAGEGEPEIILICGFFDAQYGSAIDLFGTLSTPIIEQFEEGDRLDHTLKTALRELIAQEVGAGAMSAALLKQVIVALLRRSLHSVNVWVERFSLLRDPQIARAFADMATNPGRSHTVSSLAESACLSRSAFMARFTDIIGQSPMNILRDLRMRQAAEQLKTGQLSVEQIVRNAGYESRSSFARAFRKVCGHDPSEYRMLVMNAAEELSDRANAQPEVRPAREAISNA